MRCLLLRASLSQAGTAAAMATAAIAAAKPTCPWTGWAGEGEQEEAQRGVEEHCDDGYFSCGEFLDGHGYPSDRSDGSLDSDQKSDAGHGDV